jgi:hypothetical protein
MGVEQGVPEPVHEPQVALAMGQGGRDLGRDAEPGSLRSDRFA